MHPYNLALKCWKESNHDVKAAEQLFLKEIKRQKLVDEVLHAAAQLWLRQALRSDRSQFWDIPQALPNILERTVEAREIRDDFLNYPLKNGLPLGQATQANLEIEKNYFLTNSLRYLARYRWFDLIAKGLPDADAKVSQHYSNKKLGELHRKAEESVKNSKKAKGTRKAA